MGFKASVDTWCASLGTDFERIGDVRLGGGGGALVGEGMLWWTWSLANALWAWG